LTIWTEKITFRPVSSTAERPIGEGLARLAVFPARALLDLRRWRAFLVPVPRILELTVHGGMIVLGASTVLIG
jgi:hypothetical protein